MIKRAFLLNGLAILAVVCNHAGAWGYTAMFWWVDRYRPVVAPNYDQVGSLAYYVLLTVRQLAVFSVPAFLFVSGFFVAYAARGRRSTLDWRVIKNRITHLLIPYLIWSAVLFAGELLEGIHYPPTDYLKRLLLGSAHPAYFFVPLLCQFYLLSPLLIPIARTRWRSLLLGSALIQLGTVGLRYAELFWDVSIPAPHTLLKVAFPLFFSWLFFFTFGVVAGFRLSGLKKWLSRYRWALLVVAIALGAATIIEPELIYRSVGKEWRGGVKAISANLYAVAFISCFLAFHQVPIAFSRLLHQLGKRSYGIYLLHPKLLEYVARGIRLLLPWMLAHQALLQPTLVALAVGGPILLMTIVAKSPARGFYQHLFG
jgi:membrane-bound acyltransferase YfiQ involved in biofilm formation